MRISKREMNQAVLRLDDRLQQLERRALEAQREMDQAALKLDRLPQLLETVRRLERLEEAIMRLAGTESAARKALNVPPPTDEFRERFRSVKNGKTS